MQATWHFHAYGAYVFDLNTTGVGVNLAIREEECQ